MEHSKVISYRFCSYSTAALAVHRKTTTHTQVCAGRLFGFPCHNAVHFAQNQPLPNISRKPYLRLQQGMQCKDLPFQIHASQSTTCRKQQTETAGIQLHNEQRNYQDHGVHNMCCLKAASCLQQPVLAQFQQTDIKACSSFGKGWWLGVKWRHPRDKYKNGSLPGTR